MIQQNLLRLLFVSLVAIILWVSAWNIIEILIDKYLHSINKKDNDNYRLFVLGVLGIISLGFIYLMDGMDLIV